MIKPGMLKKLWLLPFAAEFEGAHGGLVASLLQRRHCSSRPRSTSPAAPLRSVASGRWVQKDTVTFLVPHVSGYIVPCLGPSEGKQVHVSPAGRCRTRATYPAAAPDPADPYAPTPLRRSSPRAPNPNSNPEQPEKFAKIAQNFAPNYSLLPPLVRAQLDSAIFAIFIFLGVFFSFECGHGRAVMQ